MSTIQTRNKMADKIHENLFSFVANAQLFDKLRADWRIANVNHGCQHRSCFQIFTRIVVILTKQLQFLLVIIAKMNSETMVYGPPLIWFC